MRRVPRNPRLVAFTALMAAFLAFPAFAQVDEGDDTDTTDTPKYPTTQFEEGATSASVTVGEITAGVRQVRRPEIDKDHDVPVLEVMVSGKPAIEVPGVVSGMDYPAAEASIAEMDPTNKHQEVYFTSFSGGAHCCSHVVVAEELGDKWVKVDIGDFDGDGNFLDDLDGDGLAEISTVDNRFLYQFDCYACSAAPLTIYTVKGGKVVDVTRELRFQAAHREWLKQMEANIEPEDKWTSAGFLAGWVAERVRLGEGAAAFKELQEHWDSDSDIGEEVCVTGGELDSCPKASRKILKFPERLKLFLEQSGYSF